MTDRDRSRTDRAGPVEGSAGPAPAGGPSEAVPPEGDATASAPPQPDHPATPEQDPPSVADTVPAGGGGEGEDEVEPDDTDPAAVVEADLDALLKERDEYLDALRRLQADFENYRKRMLKRETEQLERAAEGLVVQLLDVLDTARLAVDHGGGEAVEQVTVKLFDVLGKEGLDVIDPTGEAFDPNRHEAVAHEDGDGPPEVLEVMRTGYAWRGRVLRPAMVKVKGS